MTRARLAFAATLIGTALSAHVALAQNPPPPNLTPILEGKKITPPLRGEAQVEFTSTKPNREKDNVVTKFTVKNASPAPIARLEIDETWYDRGGAVLTGGRGILNKLLQPGEVQIITIETPWKAGMLSNNYNFKHVNGTVKPKRVAKLDVPKPDATKK
jgi:hypothetical protein